MEEEKECWWVKWYIDPRETLGEKILCYPKDTAPEKIARDVAYSIPIVPGGEIMTVEMQALGGPYRKIRVKTPVMEPRP